LQSAEEIRSKILMEYYSNLYQNYLFENDTQGAGISYFEKTVEKFWSNTKPQKVLEIGGGVESTLSF